MSDPPIATEEILEAMTGLAYLVRPDGRILSLSQGSWDRFASENGGDAVLEPSKLVGRSIYDFIAGNAVKESYHRLSETLLSGEREFLSFPYRNDSPNVRRYMLMIISAVRRQRKIIGLLYHSILMKNEPRTPIDLSTLSFGLPGEELPALMVCSFCKDARYPAGEELGTWLSAEKYECLARETPVRLSQGICSTCRKNIVERMLRKSGKAA